ncbi:MAG TPA: hypothetical protein VFZ61_34110 [Polyangiales bacterium]
MSGGNQEGPFIVITSVLDADARPASITRSHGAAFERALSATKGQPIANLDLIELTIDKASHAALRKHLGLPEDQAGVYDVFPLPPTLAPNVRKAAAQFLAAENLWTLDAQGVFGPSALSVKLDLPAGWDKDPKAVHQKLVESGALELSDAAIETYRAIKTAWSTAG